MQGGGGGQGRVEGRQVVSRKHVGQLRPELLAAWLDGARGRGERLQCQNLQLFHHPWYVTVCTSTARTKGRGSWLQTT